MSATHHNEDCLLQGILITTRKLVRCKEVYALQGSVLAAREVFSAKESAYYKGGCSLQDRVLDTRGCSPQGSVLAARECACHKGVTAARESLDYTHCLCLQRRGHTIAYKDKPLWQQVVMLLWRQAMMPLWRQALMPLWRQALMLLWQQAVTSLLATTAIGVASASALMHWRHWKAFSWSSCTTSKT